MRRRQNPVRLRLRRKCQGYRNRKTEYKTATVVCRSFCRTPVQTVRHSGAVSGARCDLSFPERLRSRVCIFRTSAEFQPQPRTPVLVPGKLRDQKNLSHFLLILAAKPPPGAISIRSFPSAVTTDDEYLKSLAALSALAPSLNISA